MVDRQAYGEGAQFSNNYPEYWNSYFNFKRIGYNGTYGDFISQYPGQEGNESITLTWTEVVNNNYWSRYGIGTDLGELTVRPPTIIEKNITLYINQQLIETSPVAWGITGGSWMWGGAKLASEAFPVKILPRSGFNNFIASKVAGEVIGKVSVGINFAASAAGIYDLANNWDQAGSGDVAKVGVDASLTIVTSVLYISGVGTPIALVLTGIQVANTLGAFDSVYGNFNKPIKNNRKRVGRW
jgi:hypothetical protein